MTSDKQAGSSLGREHTGPRFPDAQGGRETLNSGLRARFRPPRGSPDTSSHRLSADWAAGMIRFSAKEKLALCASAPMVRRAGGGGHLTPIQIQMILTHIFGWTREVRL